MIVDLILIQIIIVCLIDLTDFVDTITARLHAWLTDGRNKQPFTIKPFTCSVCLTWWIGLIWLIIHDFSLLNLMILAVITIATPIVKDIIQTVINLIEKIIELINEKIC